VFSDGDRGCERNFRIELRLVDDLAAVERVSEAEVSAEGWILRERVGDDDFEAIVRTVEPDRSLRALGLALGDQLIVVVDGRARHAGAGGFENRSEPGVDPRTPPRDGEGPALERERPLNERARVDEIGL